MRLAKNSRDTSLKELKLQLINSNKNKESLLKKINDLAANDEVDYIMLSRQSPNVREFLFKKICDANYDNIKVRLVANNIYKQIKDKLKDETVINQKKHNEGGSFSNKPLHHRDLKDQMQASDITALMPKSTATIEVLAVIDISSYQDTNSSFVKSADTFISDQSKQHLFIPIGPGHWRGVYISKPKENEIQYKVEIFDPCGSDGAKTITDFVKIMLNDINIKNNSFKISYKGPKKLQTDGYACGDFTCAYSHKKMKALGANDKEYNEKLIGVLNSSGNKNDVLRKKTRAIMQQREQNKKQLSGSKIKKSNKKALAASLGSSKISHPDTFRNDNELADLTKLSNNLGYNVVSASAKFDAGTEKLVLSRGSSKCILEITKTNVTAKDTSSLDDAAKKTLANDMVTLYIFKELLPKLRRKSEQFFKLSDNELKQLVNKHNITIKAVTGSDPDLIKFIQTKLDDYGVKDEKELSNTNTAEQVNPANSKSTPSGEGSPNFARRNSI